MPRQVRRKHQAGKATNDIVVQSMLDERTSRATEKGFPKAKWVEFCETMISLGFEVRLYEARKSVSKYVTVSMGRNSYKVRFSNHKPIKGREIAGDCDFFVGMTHTGIRTTKDAVKEIRAVFGLDTMAAE